MSPSPSPPAPQPDPYIEYSLVHTPADPNAQILVTGIDESLPMVSGIIGTPVEFEVTGTGIQGAAGWGTPSGVVAPYGLSADEIVSAQPMTGPSSLLFGWKAAQPIEIIIPLPIDTDERFRDFVDELE